MNDNLNEALPKPIVAILTMPDTVRQLRGNLANFQDIITTGKQLGFPVYVVTVKDLKLKSPLVRGYIPNRDGSEWESQLFPLPQIIYNRIPQREDELKPFVRRKIEAILEHPNLAIFNPFFFNKWHLFEWLKSSKLTAPLVPATRQLNTPKQLFKMLERYPTLYLKPVNGKAGKGIMLLRLQKDKPLPYRLQIQHQKNSITYKAASLKRLWNRIKKETDGSPYIMQQAIDLITVDNRPFDLRLLLQKNNRGHWSISGLGARLAGQKSITTHVPRGGSIENPLKLLESAFGSEHANSIIRKVRTNALIIAKQIEKACGYRLGEMSMDLGVDKTGANWFFEANARPMKFDEEPIRKKSLQRIFDYSLYLANQKT